MASRTFVLDDDNKPCVPYLDNWNHKRSLNLNRAGNRFNRNYRFVFVRWYFGKKSPSFKRKDFS
jgi:hypothetical protein